VKVFVAGATGAIGQHLLPALVRAGHSVVAMTRTPDKVEALRAQSASPVVADALDADAVMAAVRAAEPEVVIHELTAIPPNADFRNIDREFALTNRLRREGLDHLLAAARMAQARRLIVQSFTGWPFAREGGPVKTEDDPLDPHPLPSMRVTLDTIRYLETTVLGTTDLECLGLRYGIFYGPGSSLAADGYLVRLLRRRLLPIIGQGSGVWSFVHLDDVAGATVAAVERGTPGIYNIVDDDPAPVSQWLPVLAAAVGAQPPLRVPRLLGRLIAGDATVTVMNEIRGAANDKAKRALDWRLIYPSWRDGFRTGLGQGRGANLARVP
jgi:nucleoside-diphosphate-sugar epimerase